MTCNNGAGLNEAIAAGYPVLEAKRPSKLLRELCEKLGDEYHLASIDGGNVVHRVIGSGWDVEVYPLRSGCRKYRIVLWKGYGRQSVVQESGVRSECVGPMVEMLLHLYVPPAVYPTRYDMGPRPSLGEEEQESQNSVGVGSEGPGGGINPTGVSVRRTGPNRRKNSAIKGPRGSEIMFPQNEM